MISCARSSCALYVKLHYNIHMGQNLPNRRSIRLPGFDYTYPTVYFVTIVTFQRERLFGDVIDHEMRLSTIGEIARREWLKLPYRFAHVDLDEFVIMPDHMHGLLIFKDIESRDSNRSSSTSVNEAALKAHVAAGSLGAVVRAYKSNVARVANFSRFRNSGPIWHRNYYERVIRDEQDLERVQVYIRGNPLNGAGE